MPSASNQGGVRTAALRHFAEEHLSTTEMIPVIIQFQKPPEVEYRAQHPNATQAELTAYAEQLRADHEQFLMSLRGLGMDARISTCTAHLHGEGGHRQAELQHDFTYCFNGVGLLLPGKVVQSAATHPEVKVISFNRERLYLNLQKSVPFIGAPQVWEKVAPNGKPITGEGVVIAVIDTGMCMYITHTGLRRSGGWGREPAA